MPLNCTLENGKFYRMDKQQGPTVQHRELYSISCDKPYGKVYEKEYICITESFCCTAKIKHNIVNQLYFNKI